MGFFRKFEKHVIRKPVHEVRRVIANNPPLAQAVLTVAAVACPVATPLTVALASSVGSGIDALAKHDQTKHDQKIAENEIEEKRQNQHSQIADQRSRVIEQIARERTEIQATSQEVINVVEREQTRIDNERNQQLQEIATARSHLSLNEHQLRSGRELLASYLLENNQKLDEQCQIVYELITVCQNKDLEQIKRLLTCLDAQLLVQIGNDLLEICDIDNIDIISAYINNEIETIVKREKSYKLLNASRVGNLRQLKEALKIGVDINTVTENDAAYSGYTLLHNAVHWGHLNVAKFLLENGANIKTANSRNQNLLFLTVWNCHTAGCREVLDYLLKVHQTEMRNQLLAQTASSPLHATVMNAYLDVNPCCETAIKLIQFGADIYQTDSQGRTAEQFAIEKQQPRLAEVIREYGLRQADLDERLCDAAYIGDKTALLNAINEGANVNAIGKKPVYSKFPALLIAASWGHLNAVKILLKHGADLESKSSMNHGVLYWTVWNSQTPGCREILHYLLNMYPSQMYQQLFVKADDGQTPLHATSVNAYIGVKAHDFCIKSALILIRLGVDINHKDKQGKTAEELAKERRAVRLAEVIKEQRLIQEQKNDKFYRPTDTLLNLCLNFLNFNSKGQVIRQRILEKKRYFPANLYPSLKPIQEQKIEESISNLQPS